MAAQQPAQREPLVVCITGAAGQIGYSLIPLICTGQTFGPDQPIILRLLDIKPAEKMLGGVVLEIEDGAYPLLHGVQATTNVQEAFADCDVAILTGGFPRGPGMERAALMAKNSPIFVEQGQALNKVAKRTCKVLVVANPANSNCLIAATNAPDLPKTNFSALTRLDQNRAKGQLAIALKCAPAAVRNVNIWGNHSSTMFVDTSKAEINNGGKFEPITGRLSEEFLAGEYATTVAKRGAAVIAARGLSSAMSAANAIKDHLKSWVLGTAEGETVSMGIWSTGNPYQVEPGLMYSFPVTCANGEYTIVKDLPISEQARAALRKTEEELIAERAEALNPAVSGAGNTTAAP